MKLDQFKNFKYKLKKTLSSNNHKNEQSNQFRQKFATSRQLLGQSPQVHTDFNNHAAATKVFQSDSGRMQMFEVREARREGKNILERSLREFCTAFPETTRLTEQRPVK